MSEPLREPVRDGPNEPVAVDAKEFFFRDVDDKAPVCGNGTGSLEGEAGLSFPGLTLSARYFHMAGLRRSLAVSSELEPGSLFGLVLLPLPLLLFNWRPAPRAAALAKDDGGDDFVALPLAVEDVLELWLLLLLLLPRLFLSRLSLSRLLLLLLLVGLLLGLSREDPRRKIREDPPVRNRLMGGKEDPRLLLALLLLC